jgi:hypothetical protein
MTWKLWREDAEASAAAEVAAITWKLPTFAAAVVLAMEADERATREEISATEVAAVADASAAA